MSFKLVSSAPSDVVTFFQSWDFLPPALLTVMVADKSTDGRSVMPSACAGCFGTALMRRLHDAKKPKHQPKTRTHRSWNSDRECCRTYIEPFTVTVGSCTPQDPFSCSGHRGIPGASFGFGLRASRLLQDLCVFLNELLVDPEFADEPALQRRRRGSVAPLPGVEHGVEGMPERDRAHGRGGAVGAEVLSRHQGGNLARVAAFRQPGAGLPDEQRGLLAVEQDDRAGFGEPTAEGEAQLVVPVVPGRQVALALLVSPRGVQRVRYQSPVDLGRRVCQPRGGHAEGRLTLRLDDWGGRGSDGHDVACLSPGTWSLGTIQVVYSCSFEAVLGAGSTPPQDSGLRAAIGASSQAAFRHAFGPRRTTP